MTYDAEKRLIEAESSTATINYVYDCDGNMAIKTEGFITTAYIGNYFEVSVDNSPPPTPTATSMPPTPTKTATPTPTSRPTLAPRLTLQPPRPPKWELPLNYYPPSKLQMAVVPPDGIQKALTKPVPHLLVKTVLTSTIPPAGQTWRKYYFAGSQRVAMKVQEADGSSEVHYLLTDHLGSTALIIPLGDRGHQRNQIA